MRYDMLASTSTAQASPAAIAAGMPSGRLSLDELFALFDRDGNGRVDFVELGAGLSMLCGGAEKEKARAVFHLMDADSSGRLDLGEITNYLEATQVVLPPPHPKFGSKEF